MSRWIIGLLLFASVPVSADTPNVGQVVVQSTIEKRWFVAYKTRLISCKVRRSCKDFTSGRYFIPVLQFKRSSELVEYVDDKGVFTDCMLRECRGF